MAAHFAAMPALSRADVVVAVSPSFSALLPAVVYTRARRLPLVLWLHDILPDGAAATGMLDPGLMLRASRWLERTAYREAARIVVLSQSFAANLRHKGVPDAKVDLIYDPATRPLPERPASNSRSSGPRLLAMGNIGLS